MGTIIGDYIGTRQTVEPEMAVAKWNPRPLRSTCRLGQKPSPAAAAILKERQEAGQRYTRAINRSPGPQIRKDSRKPNPKTEINKDGRMTHDKHDVMSLLCRCPVHTGLMQKKGFSRFSRLQAWAGIEAVALPETLAAVRLTKITQNPETEHQQKQGRHHRHRHQHQHQHEHHIPAPALSC